LEKEIMEIKNFIKIYDEVMPIEVLSNLIRYCSKIEFDKAGIVGKSGGEVDFNVRRTYIHSLTPISNSMTEVHWTNFLQTLFFNGISRYGTDLKMIDFKINRLLDIAILKYENTGFYTWHVDHGDTVPRTISCILLLNNDYEGGNLCFRNPDGSEEWEVDVVPNRLIIWPSNFLYPHTVKPITKGIRYSVVAWAI